MPRYSPRTGQLETYQVGPFDSTHLYVQWGGKLPGNEQWSCGFRMWKTGGSGNQDAITALPGVAAALAEFHVHAMVFISPLAKFSFVKVNAIGTNGQYIGDGTNQALYADLAGAGGFNSNHPNQVALTATLNTGFSRGPAHRGRFYLPLPDVDVASDGLIQTAIADSIREQLNVLRTNVNAAAGGEVMVVMSRKAGAPGHRAVTAITVGRALDTQRRRRRSLVEDHQ